MNYILYGLFGVILFFVIINYLRKLHWDAIHNNLLDLEDEIGGAVIRKGFLARPVFHAKYKGSEVTINFSQDKRQGKRINYIDIIGGLGIAYFAFSEGKEAFEKAKSKSISCDCSNACSK